jgi:hypothetical protein
MQPQLGVRLRLLRAASARFVSHHVRRVLAATYQLAGYRVRRRGTHPYSSIAYHCQQLRTLSSELCARAPYERTDSSCTVRTVPCVAIVCTVVCMLVWGCVPLLSHSGNIQHAHCSANQRGQQRFPVLTSAANTIAWEDYRILASTHVDALRHERVRHVPCCMACGFIA